MDRTSRNTDAPPNMSIRFCAVRSPAIFRSSNRPDSSVNLKTAKALSFTVPLIMQMTADAVIE
jgi:hypothetical protein